jgi:hypothetical protein
VATRRQIRYRFLLFAVGTALVLITLWVEAAQPGWWWLIPGLLAFGWWYALVELLVERILNMSRGVSRRQ